MPGIHLVFSPALANNACSHIPAGLARESDYSVSTVACDDHLLCVVSAYPHYPVATLRSADTVIIFEGMVYNMSSTELRRRLFDVSRYVGNRDEAVHAVATLVDQADGEFLAAMYNARSHQLLVFNDRWARLPAYVYSNDRQLIISRELKFLLPWLPRRKFDPVGVADFLLFEFVPGDGTILEGVQSLPHAFLLQASCATGRLTTLSGKLATECLDDPPGTISRQACCERIRHLLLEATSSRVSSLQQAGYDITADLSGGFDSRIVCAALAQVGAAASLYTDALITGDESACASKVADILHLPLHHVIAPRMATPAELAAITIATDCTVNAWTSLASRQDSLARRQLCHTTSVRFLGLGGGDFIKRTPRLKRGYRSIGRQMAAGHQVGLGSMELVARLTGMPVTTLVEHIDSVLQACGERSGTGLLRRWDFECERKLVTYGEDRSRAWLWPVAPLWSRRLYEFVLTQVPARYGHGPSGLYFELLALFDPALASAPLHGAVSTRGPALFKHRVAEAVSDAVRFATASLPGSPGAVLALRVRKPGEACLRESLPHRLLQRQLQQSNPLWNTVDPRVICRATHAMRAAHAWRLLTLALFARHITGIHPEQSSLPWRT